ncbi:hypothetical protein OGATHE_002010 [Ogataea polymorpha]|uniref:Uncharacterized protein n=1 Tax=Ogataea polymorpha TaxID=460523 RepID=A0A9P8TD12_9ASCO|nr:hypothetical protein OGATHE_002010 [Ogataea polymorpha]
MAPGTPVIATELQLQVCEFHGGRANQFFGRVPQNNTDFTLGPVVDDLVVADAPRGLLALFDNACGGLELTVNIKLGKYVSGLLVVLVVRSGAQEPDDGHTGVKVWRWRVGAVWKLGSLQGLHHLEVQSDMSSFSVVSQNRQRDVSKLPFEHDILQIHWAGKLLHHLVDKHVKARDVEKFKWKDGVSAKRLGQEVEVRSLQQRHVDRLDVRETLHHSQSDSHLGLERNVGNHNWEREAK